jgi:predicted RNase H-like nuclease (RuvC/YqgF family)
VARSAAAAAATSQLVVLANRRLTVVADDIIRLQGELHAALERAGEWELTARRASAGAQSSSKGAERLHRKVCRLRDEIKILKGRIERIQHENGEQQKKISRLSLELLSHLSTTEHRP